MLDRAVADGMFRSASLTEPNDVALFGELTGHLGRGEADADKATLEERRFKMPFGSFGEVVR